MFVVARVWRAGPVLPVLDDEHPRHRGHGGHVGEDAGAGGVPGVQQQHGGGGRGTVRQLQARDNLAAEVDTVTQTLGPVALQIHPGGRESHGSSRSNHSQKFLF